MLFQLLIPQLIQGIYFDILPQMECNQCSQVYSSSEALLGFSDFIEFRAQFLTDIRIMKSILTATRNLRNHPNRLLPSLCFKDEMYETQKC